MTVRIRSMEVADAEGVGRMHHQAWIDTYGEHLPRGGATLTDARFPTLRQVRMAR